MNERRKVRKLLGDLIKKTDLTPQQPPKEAFYAAGVTAMEGRAMVASWALAEQLKLEGETISRAIRRIEATEAFHRAHFLRAKDPQGQPAWWLSFEGFMLLMGEGLGLRPIPQALREAYMLTLRTTEVRILNTQLEAARERGRLDGLQAAGALVPQAAPVEAARTAAQPGDGRASGGLMPVPFRGATLFVVDKDGEPYAPMRPIVEGMGLAWQPQHEKLKAERFSSTITEMVTVAQDGKQREMTCMPVRKLAGWLMTISPNKVKPELRDKILAYQNECDDVLWRHWSGQARQAAPEPQPVVEAVARRAGPYVLDSAFFRTLHLALGRRAVKTEIVFRLLGAGALDQPVCMTLRTLGGEGQPDAISAAGIHRALKQLCDQGLVMHEPATSRLQISGQALAELLDKQPAQVLQLGLKKLH